MNLDKVSRLAVTAIVIVVMIVIVAEDIVPPMVLDSGHFRFGNLVTGDLAPPLNFLRLFGARLTAIFNEIILIGLTNFHDFLIDDGGAFAITSLVARRKANKRHSQQYDKIFLHFLSISVCKNTNLIYTTTKRLIQYPKSQIKCKQPNRNFFFDYLVLST